MRRALCLISLVMFAPGCDYSEEKKTTPVTAQLQTGPSDVDWLMQNLFQPSCSRCHNAGNRAGGFQFENANDLLNPTQAGAILPGNAQGSLIYSVIANGSMPPRGAKPDAAAVKVLSCWIDQGTSPTGASCTTTAVVPGPVPSASPTPSPAPTPPEPVPTFAELFTSVLEPNCVGCHNSGYPAAGINLESKASILANDDLVRCGRADNSLLYKVVAKNAMPLGGPALKADEKKSLRLWIDGDCP
ncbi:MAG TPA: c-type cytochrome domain-containing protein [Oligoflexus sp.]|uniref:c-type cytochrome domain-containing protein n=1 Tax=Oligoflexus sp. TaxID=1971216 RepID=UPI002D80BF74|nr:c-type cytochrome domain-containing protein [Oligoflexus sp.]HET9236205.1 c-type cytochrome domain-containing protein [Oligoflexus sp.]